MASFVAPGLVEAYVVKKLHKEKMKIMGEELGRSQDSTISDNYGKKKKILFGLLKKKVHPKEFPKQAGRAIDSHELLRDVGFHQPWRNIRCHDSEKGKPNLRPRPNRNSFSSPPFGAVEKLGRLVWGYLYNSEAWKPRKMKEYDMNPYPQANKRKRRPQWLKDFTDIPKLP